MIKFHKTSMKAMEKNNATPLEQAIEMVLGGDYIKDFLTDAYSFLDKMKNEQTKA